MAIVKATYTKKVSSAKASIRYIAHRPGKDGAKEKRILFGIDGLLGRWQAYQFIDEAEKGSFFYRFVIAPDPAKEDSEKDLFLRDVTERTMNTLQERLNTPLFWVGVEHNDHAPHRHVHILTIVPGRLQVQDFQAMRQEATSVCLEQRQALAQRAQMQERGEQWELQR